MEGFDARGLLRYALDQFRAGAVPEGADSLSAVREYLAACAVPDFVCIMQPIPPTPPQVHRGLEGFDAAWSDYGGAFETMRIEFEEVLESEEHIVSFGNQIATTRHGGVEISQPSALLFAFEDGLVSRIEFHIDRDAALRAAGLKDG